LKDDLFVMIPFDALNVVKMTLASRKNTGADRTKRNTNEISTLLGSYQMINIVVRFTLDVSAIIKCGLFCRST
jgi:hypothetical protein